MPSRSVTNGKQVRVLINPRSTFPSVPDRRRDFNEITMNKFVQAIRSQEAYMKKPKPRKEQLPTDRRPPMKDSQIVQALHLMKMGLSPSHIAKELDVPVQTVYNVRQRYQLIKLEDGKDWYIYLGV